MENLHSSKAPKLKSLSRKLLPINMQNAIGRRYHHSIFDPYASDSSNSPSPLAKYLRSTTPLAAIENLQTPPTVFRAPMKVEEDVLVMDGILIEKSNKSCDSGGVRVRSSVKSSDSRRGSLGSLISSSLSLSSPGGGDGGNENNNRSLYCYKAENCRSCEDSSICRFGSKCQFAHRKEELRLRTNSSSSNSKFEICESHNISGGSSSSSYGTKCRFGPHEIKAAQGPAITPTLPIPMALPTSPIEVKQPSDAFVFSRPSTTSLTTSDWTPQDDEIEITLPCGTTERENPSREDVDDHIQKVLYGTEDTNFQLNMTQVFVQNKASMYQLI
ncbi:unnamed protein product [Fraxinus pennsylvanica]|uniref:C3H1-type domain-containing protein n=1 Tax=Fraxinus pennsylvanica TaxID=56036 RepID=A0AAD1ZG84_9LAMI|nr:unnamed protein product [Fraxinus pennsylvanica]